jgi:hypothetical protein
MKRWVGWLRRFFVGLTAALVALGLAAGLLILNNNMSLSRQNRADFMIGLDRSLAASAGWTIDQFRPDNSGKVVITGLGKEFASNPALVHMLVDCAAMSNDPQLRDLVSKIVAVYRSKPMLLGKLVDPTIDGPPVNSPELFEYQRWFSHAVAPAAFPLSPAEQADMLSPDKFTMYDATHQLFALDLDRKFNGDTPELRSVIDRLAERIAGEATLDFRVSDLYLQRVAFLLAAGRPDLVKPRWVERALNMQQNDGGWRYTWHGWGPGLLDYTFGGGRSIAHSTAQGIWLTNMLKYRYPDWIDRHYK